MPSFKVPSLSSGHIEHGVGQAAGSIAGMGMLVGHGAMKDDLQGQSQEQCRMQVEKKWQESAGGNFKQKSLDATSRGWLHFDLPQRH